MDIKGDDNSTDCIVYQTTLKSVTEKYFRPFQTHKMGLSKEVKVE